MPYGHCPPWFLHIDTSLSLSFAHSHSMAAARQLAFASSVISGRSLPRGISTSVVHECSASSVKWCHKETSAGIPMAAVSAAPAVEARPSSVIRKIEKELKSRERSALEVTEAFLERLEAREPLLESFLHVAREKSLEQAAAIDRQIAVGVDLGPLAGIPIAAKDNLCTMDMPSTGGSRVLEGYRPPYDATAIQRLRLAGAVVLGKTNLDEFGMGSSTECSGYKVTSNPWDLSRVPGGSSGGSGAAVSAGLCAGALGSDTGGSIRLPASFCGVAGLKPTYGRVSRYGLMAYASSLDVVGCLSPSVEDAALLLGAIAGHDPADSTSSSKPVEDYAAAIEAVEKFPSQPLKGLRFGLIQETMGKGVDKEVAAAITRAVKHLEELGATIIEVSLPTFEYGLPAYYVLAPSEASSNLARYDGIRYGPREDGVDLTSLYTNTRGGRLGHEVKRRILMGTYALSAGYYDAFYKRAQQVRTLIQRDFSSALSQYDILLAPTSPTPAWKKGEKSKDPLELYAGDLMTVNVNLAGLPAMVVPCGLVEGGPHGLPVGIQMIGRAFGEVELLRCAHIFEQTCPHWTFKAPELAL